MILHAVQICLSKKQETEKMCAGGVVRIETSSEQEKLEEKSTEFLQKLSSEEANLIEERQNLISLREKLQSKVLEKIERKKNNIQKIRDEIKELKFSCEELTKTLKVGTSVK